MANYYASARSNYFQVKDSKVFEEWVDSIPGLGIFTKQGDSATLYAIYDNGGDACGWPSYDMKTTARLIWQKNWLNTSLKDRSPC